MAYNMLAAVGAAICVFGLFVLTTMRQNRLINGRSLENFTPLELYGSIALLIGTIACAALAVMSILL